MYDNTNRLSLWLNKDRKSQNHPHLKGQGETNMPVWASAWFSDDIPDDDKRALAEIIKRHNSASRKPFLTVSMRQKDFQGKQPDQQTAGLGTNVLHQSDDDIPF